MAKIKRTGALSRRVGRKIGGGRPVEGRFVVRSGLRGLCSANLGG